MTRAETAGAETRTAKADAMEFLQAALAGDPVPATEVSRMAHEHGLTAKVVRAAREALKVNIERNGFGPGSRSLWSLPRKAPQEGQPKNRACMRPPVGSGFARPYLFEPLKPMRRASFVQRLAADPFEQGPFEQALHQVDWAAALAAIGGRAPISITTRLSACLCIAARSRPRQGHAAGTQALPEARTTAATR
jgi:hypothetical protein